MLGFLLQILNTFVPKFMKKNHINEISVLFG